MILAFVLGLTATGMAPRQADAEPDFFKQALECRVYTAMAPALYADHPGAYEMSRKLHRYWLKRSEDLGAKAGISQQGVEMNRSSSGPRRNASNP